MSDFFYSAAFWGIITLSPAICVGMAGYRLNETISQHEVEKLQDATQVLTSAVHELETARDQLQTENADLQAHFDRVVAEGKRDKQLLQIGEQTRQALVSSLADNDNELKNLQEELEIYRKVVSGAGEQAIRIYDWQVDSLPGDRHYGYKLVLVRAVEGDGKIQGKVDITLEGISGDEKKMLPLSELGVPAGRIGFKNFQSFQGDFTLPVEFMPTRVRVGVTFAGKNTAEVEKWYFWHNA